MIFFYIILLILCGFLIIGNFTHQYNINKCSKCSKCNKTINILSAGYLDNKNYNNASIDIDLDRSFELDRGNIHYWWNSTRNTRNMSRDIRGGISNTIYYV